MKTKSNLIIYTIISILVLEVICMILTALTSLSYLESTRIVFGSIYALFLPGFILSFLFFQKTKSEEKVAIDITERIALSFALSIAVVPLIVFYLNLIGLKINTLNSFLTILGIIIISLTILYFKEKKHDLKNPTTLKPIATSFDYYAFPISQKQN